MVHGLPGGRTALRRSVRGVITGASALAAVLALATACTSRQAAAPNTSSPPGPTTTTAASSTPLASPSTSVSSAPSSGALTTTEAAARSAVEASWARFWALSGRLASASRSSVGAEIAAVAVEPTKSQMMTQFNLFQSLKQGQYGYVVNHPYWTQSIGGKSTAVMGDCVDGSHSGTLSLVTGKKLTVGPARDNARATFVQDASGTWRVRLVEYLLDQKC